MTELRNVEADISRFRSRAMAASTPPLAARYRWVLWASSLEKLSCEPAGSRESLNQAMLNARRSLGPCASHTLSTFAHWSSHHVSGASPLSIQAVPSSLVVP